jgi:hypothetical protein
VIHTISSPEARKIQQKPPRFHHKLKAGKEIEEKE